MSCVKRSCGIRRDTSSHFGISELLNHRLIQDFDYIKKVDISIAAYVSLAGKNDLELMKVSYDKANEYKISLGETESFFIFPYQADIISQKTKMYEGMVLSDSLKEIVIESIDARSVPIILRVKNIQKKIPVLYFSQGKIQIDLENLAE